MSKFQSSISRLLLSLGRTRCLVARLRMGVLLEMPRNPLLDLPQMDVLPIQHNPTQSTAVTVLAAFLHLDGLADDPIEQHWLGCLAEGLSLLRRVDAGPPTLRFDTLFPYFDRIAVRDAHHAADEVGVGHGRRQASPYEDPEAEWLQGRGANEAGEKETLARPF